MGFINRVAVLTCSTFLLGGTSHAFQVIDGDTVIRGGQVIDGTGAPARQADVVIRKDRIAAIDTLPEDLSASVTLIDARGKAITPGFIDTHSHGDPASDPELHNFLAMGVTTLCLGQDGGSVRVANMDKFFRDIETTPPAPNILTFIGHGTVRSEAGVRLSPNPTTGQLTAMSDLVEKAMQQGAWGLTTGLEYQPGMFATKEELAAVAKPVGRRGLVVMSHMRNEDDDQLTSSISELVEQCRASGAHAHISHIKSVYGKGKARAEEILAYLEKQRATGVQITADTYPYTASNTGLSILFPHWALPPNSYSDVLTSRRAELVSYLHERVAKRNGPEAMLLGSGANAGKTLAQVAAERQKPYAEVLVDMGPRGGSAAYFVMDEPLQDRLLVADGVNICTDAGSGGVHPRGYGSFAKIIRKFVIENKSLTIEQAVNKMSGLPAQTIGLDKAGRGTLKVGNYADVLVFDPAQVKDTATFHSPNELAVGIDTIFVNGTIVRLDGRFTSNHAGRGLRRKE